MKKYKWCLLCFLAVIAVGGAVALWILNFKGDGENSPGKDDIKDGYYLLTMDGYGITEEEFRMFLIGERTTTAGYFYQQYGAQPEGDFWVREYDGQTPLDYAKNLALQKLMSVKMEFILADERGLSEYIDFDGMAAQMERANAEREQKIKDGEVVYGPSYFDIFTYYSYVRSNLWLQLKTSQEGITQVSDSQLIAMYNENLQMYDNGYQLTYEARYKDGETEVFTIAPQDIGNEDYETAALFDMLMEMNEGENTGELTIAGRALDITLISKVSLGVQAFEEVRENLKQQYAENELRDLLALRVKAAVVQKDKKRFDNLDF